MHDIVKGVGFLAAIIGVIAIVIGIVVGGTQNNPSAILAGLSVGLSAILSGAILYCFGAIVEHLIAIRKAAERQVEIFDRLGKVKG